MSTTAASVRNATPPATGQYFTAALTGRLGRSMKP